MPKVYFEKEKKHWREMFLKELNHILSDEEAMAEAVGARESITKNGVKYTEFDENELARALTELDKGEPGIYSLYDPGRVGQYLAEKEGAGFSQEERNSMKLSDKLKYEAAVTNALQRITEGEKGMDKLYRPYLDDGDEVALQDSKDFKKVELLCLLAKPRIQLAQACVRLDKVATDPGSSNDPMKQLKAAGAGVLERVKEATKKVTTQAELITLTNFVEGTANVIESPIPKNMDVHEKNTKKAFGINRSWGKLVGGALLCVLGAALLVAAIAATVFSFGVTLPLLIPALAVCTKLVVVGTIISAGAAASPALVTAAAASIFPAAVTGIGSIVGGSIFTHRSRKGELVPVGERVTKEAKKVLNTEIDKIVEFLRVNVDFFAAPFTSDGKFQEWAKGQEQIFPLLKGMDQIFSPNKITNEELIRAERFTSFADAICGKALEAEDRKNSLLGGNEKRIRKFLAENPDAVQMFKKHTNNPAIDEWYQTQAKEFQQKGQMERQRGKQISDEISSSLPKIRP